MNRLIRASVAAMCLLLTALVDRSTATAVGPIAVPGTSDPWLAGMPDGSTASSGDVAPDESPVEVLGLNIAAGGIVTFSATGCVSNTGGGCSGTPDGSGFFNHFAGAQNGISDVRALLNSLLGVFLDSAQPDLTPAPGLINFQTLGTGFATLSPALKQVFFIGDGLTGTGTGSTQEFDIPSEATRLFLGTMDGFGWFNNSGTIQVTINGPGFPVGVPQPGSLLLLAFGIAAMSGIIRRRGRQH